MAFGTLLWESVILTSVALLLRDIAGIGSAPLYIKAARGANGKGKRVADGFVVFKNSEITGSTVPSFPKGFNALREELLKNEIIKKTEEKLIFITDYLFSSPSAAAAVVMGRSANGLKEWKDSKGNDLKFIEEQEINKANEAFNTDPLKLAG